MSITRSQPSRLTIVDIFQVSKPFPQSVCVYVFDSMGFSLIWFCEQVQINYIATVLNSLRQVFCIFLITWLDGHKYHLNNLLLLFQVYKYLKYSMFCHSVQCEHTCKNHRQNCPVVIINQAKLQRTHLCLRLLLM